MIRLSILGIFVSISILAAPSQVSAALWKETPAGPPENLTDMQKTEWQIGNFVGWLRLCDYHSKASEVTSFMKLSPYFRKGVSQYAKYDMSTSCGGFDENLKNILGQKERWEQYLESTYLTYNASPQRSLNGLWAGTGHPESGSCKMSSMGFGKIESIHFELIVREPEISGRVTKAHHNYKSLVHVDASIRGIVSESGEFNLQFGVSELGAEIVLQGRLSNESNRASGKWNTPNCRGLITFTRKSPY